MTLRLRNPTRIRLFSSRLQRHLDGGEAVRITEDEARDLEGGAVFKVEKVEPPAERETVRRGSKRAEVSRPPVREKRG